MLATRRSLMAAVAVLPITACPAPATAAPLAATDRDWDRVCAAYDRANEALVAAIAAYNKQERAWAAAGGFAEPKPVEPFLADNATSMTTSELVAAVQSPGWVARCASYDADLAAWIARKSAAERAVMGEAEDAMTEAESKSTDAFVAMRRHRVPTLAALAVKVEYMAERYGDDYEASEAQALINDIRHLTGWEA
jgi:hypothetical protein